MRISDWSSDVCSSGLFQRRRFGQADDAVLGGDVSRQVRCADQAGDRRTIDDRAAAALEHLRNLEPHAVPDTGEIDTDDTVPVLGRAVGGQCRLAIKTGGVERTVEDRKSSVYGKGVSVIVDL